MNKYISIKFRRPDHNKRDFIYDKCWRENGPYHEWIANLDADEFVVMANKSLTIPDYLQLYKDFPGVRMYWRIFSSSGLTRRPPSVLGNF